MSTAEALDLMAAESREIAAHAGLRVGRIGIGDPRSRWGSCTHDGDLRYSWRLILAPPDVRLSTVAHELAQREFAFNREQILFGLDLPEKSAAPRADVRNLKRAP